MVGSATRVDAAGRAVTLANGDVIHYDYLIYAVGSGSAEPGVPGAAEHAYPIASLEEVERLRPVIDATTSMRATAAITVVGAGPTGIEIAAELAEQGRNVTVVCGGELGPYLHPRGRRAVAERFDRLGVKVLDGPGSMVKAVTRDAVELSDGRSVTSDVTIWATGFGVPELARRSGLSTDAVGRLRTDETLTSVDDPRIVAAGDSAAPSDLPYRMSCQAAVQLGPQAAETVLSRIAGERPRPVDVGFAGQCISLGRRAGIYQFAHKNDVALGFHLGGRPGASLKEFICKSILWQLALEARRPGRLNLWAKDAKRHRLLQKVRA